MKYAVIAAGEGSRLQQEGVSSHKPLVRIGGEMLIDRLFRVFQEHGATAIVVISSMHSMWELSRWLGDEPFVLTTVDTIFREKEFTSYVQTFQTLVAQGQADGLMGVTDYIDDEKPLYVETDDHLQITGFLDHCDHPRYISGGIYGLTPRSIATLQRCIERGESRMRNFQRALVSDGLVLKAWPFSKVLDIDHAADIVKAEEFLEVKNEE